MRTPWATARSANGESLRMGDGTAFCARVDARTSWPVTIDLSSSARFLKLRLAGSALWEVDGHKYGPGVKRYVQRFWSHSNDVGCESANYSVWSTSATPLEAAHCAGSQAPMAAMTTPLSARRGRDVW